MNTFAMLLRRETWEHRSIYLAPLVVAGVGIPLFAFFMAVVGPGHANVVADGVVLDGPRMVELLEALGMRQRAMILSGFLASSFAGFVMLMMTVTFFYLLDTLFAERKDRSILFWKSMPVSDAQTVLAKLTTAMGVVPAVTLTITYITFVALLLILSLVVLFSGGSVGELILGPLPAGRLLWFTVYTAAAVWLWYAPIFGWLLLVSVWAKRLPILWATLVPISIGAIEGMTTYGTRFFDLIGDRFSRVFEIGFTTHDLEFEFIMDDVPRDFTESILSPNLQGLLTEPGLWGGLVVTAVFVTGAIMLRRYRDET